MKGKMLFCSGILLFVHADSFFPSDYDARYSLTKDEVYIEIGSLDTFDPYNYLLENRHEVSETKQKRFNVRGDVDVKKLGEYTVHFNEDMSLKVIVQDTTPPQLELASMTLKQNDAFSWNKDTLTKVIKKLSDNETSSDALKEKLQCDKVDTAKSGNQYINCSVKDNSGNVAKHALTVYVESPHILSSVNRSATPAIAKEDKIDPVIHIPTASYSNYELYQIQQVAGLVNQIRAENGLNSLSLDLSDFHNVTFLRVLEVASNYSHTRPDGRACYTIYGDYGLGYRSSGENIARGQKTAQEVVNDWMNSPAHRANILRPEFTRICIGTYGHGDSKFWVQEFFS